MIDTQSEDGAYARFFRQRDGNSSPALRDHIVAHPAPDTDAGLDPLPGPASGLIDPVPHAHGNAR